MNEMSVSSQLRERARLFISGRWVEPVTAERQVVVCPATEQVVGYSAATTRDELDQAVESAREARIGPWAGMDLDERTAVIERAAEALSARGEEIAEVVSLEQGMPHRTALHGIVPASTRMMRTAVDCIRQIPLREIRQDSTGKVLVEQEPVGVVAAMVPFNGPLPIAILKVVPALLAGCPVVLKPSPLAPLAVCALADALDEARLPAGMLNLVTGGSDIGEAMVSHPDVDMISFTGSTAVGRQIAARAGERLKRVSLELGGKSAALICEDADMSSATALIGGGTFSNAGQYCRALTRVLAPGARYEETVAGLCAVAERMRPGDPFDEATTMAPLISEAQRERVESYVQLAIEEGAKLVCGGDRFPGLDRGYFYQPTVFGDVNNSMRVAREEIFGPVIAVMPYEDLEDAIQQANDSEYGLSGAVFTSDLHRGFELARRVETGTIGVNQHGARSCAPCGGVKSSGIGQEHGPEGVREFLTPKAMMIPDELAGELEAQGVQAAPAIR